MDDLVAHYAGIFVVLLRDGSLVKIEPMAGYFPIGFPIRDEVQKLDADSAFVKVSSDGVLYVGDHSCCYQTPVIGDIEWRKTA